MKTKNLTEYVEVVKKNGKTFFLVKSRDNYLPETLKSIKYANVEMGPGELGNVDGNKQNFLEVVALNNEFEDFLKDILSIYKGDNIISFFNKFEDFFKSKTFNYLKFRGDIAELLFIWYYGGEKLMDSWEADISWNNKYIEVKSLSKSKKTITISGAQLENNNLVAVVPVSVPDTGLDCLNIIELSKKIPSNCEFKNYILKEYGDTDAAEIKFKIAMPKEWKKINNPFIEWPIKSAKYDILIDYFKLEDFSLN